MNRRLNKFVVPAVFAAAFFWWSCDDGQEAPVAPEMGDVVPQFVVQSPPAGGGSGAIFTTTPDGSIVNENVHYEFKREVYLDGGPPPNAPAKAAGLDEGLYVFQITDPPGKLLLSVDPARCRVVHVNADGVIDRLVPPMELGFGTNNWADAETKGQYDYSQQPCHQDPNGDGSAGTDPVNVPDFSGLGRHDTNTDLDHGSDAEAIVVQMMPFGTTPNPGGVYKAWLTPLAAYLDVKDANLNVIPADKNGKVRPHDCPDFCADPDPGFVPSHRYTKTDNFKVEEAFTGEIRVRKFHDLNGNGVWDEGEPEIGVDEFVDDETGARSNTPGTDFGGWPFEYMEPGFASQTEYTPFLDVIENPGTYSAEEKYFPGVWVQTASRLNGVYDSPFRKKVDVTVTASGETHEIVFGNFYTVQVTACKYEDYDGDGGKDEPIEGWTVHLTIDDAVADTQLTGEDGCYTWSGLGPLAAGSYYDVKETVPTGWTPTSPTDVDFESPPMSGAKYRADFTNFENVEVTACKYEDMDGDGVKDMEDNPIEGWKVFLTVNDTRVDEELTGSDGCYTWSNLPPLPRGGTFGLFDQDINLPSDADSYYDAEEETREGWYPTTDTQFDFEAPPTSGATYRAEFLNFRLVDVTACKVKDADGLASTIDDRTPKGGWPVYLTKNGEIQDTQVTDATTGCYTWEDLPPVPGGYYDVGEEAQEGWVALGPTYHVFETPPQSGASYSFVFVNTPTQGCTPGFWQGGSDGGQAGGQWLWNDVNDPDWTASGGEGTNPFIWTTLFNDFFTSVSALDGLTMMDLVNTGGTADDARKAARSLVAAYLNASWGVAYAYSTTELEAMWDAAVSSGGFLALHMDLDAANNAPGGCPISASGY